MEKEKKFRRECASYDLELHRRYLKSFTDMGFSGQYDYMGYLAGRPNEMLKKMSKITNHKPLTDKE